VKLRYPVLLRQGLVLTLAGAIIPLVVACGSTVSSVPTPASSAQGPGSVGNVSYGQLEPILATKALRVGTQRVAFLLVTSQSLVRAPEATVTSSFLDGSGEMSETKQAKFHLWPYGLRGTYSTELTFGQPGRWRLDITVDDEGTEGRTQLVVNVEERVSVPEIGTIPH